MIFGLRLYAPNTNSLNSLPTHVKAKNVSNLWRGITKVWYKFKEGVIWSLCNGNKIKFWEGEWIQNGVKLSALSTRRTPSEFKGQVVVDFVGQDSAWRWSLFSDWLPASVMLQIASTSSPLGHMIEDRLVWKYSSSGIFNLNLYFLQRWMQQTATGSG